MSFRGVTFPRCRCWPRPTIRACSAGWAATKSSASSATAGMGWVLKGFDTALNRYVAIKVLAPHLAASGSARKRFAREARAAAAVVHDNVIAIHGVAEWNGLALSGHAVRARRVARQSGSAVRGRWP